jgi:hypothetical protein
LYGEEVTAGFHLVKACVQRIVGILLSIRRHEEIFGVDFEDAGEDKFGDFGIDIFRNQDLAFYGFPSNVIPVEPVKKTFTVTKDGNRMTVNRTQLPLTLAYAFTDYRSQGQTLAPVIVDIGPPPYGHLTPFNIYVALSRGTGRDNI